MSKKIPPGITRDHLLKAIADFERGASHAFGKSTGYDVLHESRRYPPKAIVGLAAGQLLGAPLVPDDFGGGLNSKCFRVLEENGFTIITKGDTHPFPDEVTEDSPHTEGAVQRVLVNRYERDAKARDKAISLHGARCQVCNLDFKTVYGAIGEGFIHVHHAVPLSEIGQEYTVNPATDLNPVCPNCHAMLHKRVPPYTVEELRGIVEQVKHGG